MTQLSGFIYGQLKNPLSPGGEPGSAGTRFLTRANNIFYRLGHLPQVNTHANQNLGRYPLFLPNHTEEDMLGADVAVIQTLSLILG